MAIGVNVQIDGVDDLLAGFKFMRKEANAAVERAVNQTSLAIETDSKKRLRGMLGSAKHWITGRLAASIYNRKVTNNEKVVGTNAEYAPYIEFGIGDFVEIPQGLEEVAAQYKGKKKVKGFKGDSYLNWAAVNQASKFRERLIKELNKIK